MNVDLIKIPTKDNFELNAAYKKFNDKKIIVIYIHGMTSSFLGSNGANVYSACQETGVNFLGLNTRGANIIDNLKRYNTRGEKERLVCGTSFENFEDSLIDLQAAVDFLKEEQGYKEIILVGHSTGCQKTAYFQKVKQLKEIIGIIMIAPVEDIPGQEKILGKELFKESLEYAKKRVEEKKELEIMPDKYQTVFFSCKRYYNLYSGDSNEAKIICYQNNLEELNNLSCKLGVVLAREDEYAIISPQKMKKYYNNLDVETVVEIVPGNHSFAETKKELIEALKKIVQEIEN